MKNGDCRKLCRLLAVILVVDGLLTIAWGRGFITWQRRLAPEWYRPVLTALLGWPEPLLRLGAVTETAIAGVWLAQLLRGDTDDVWQR